MVIGINLILFIPICLLLMIRELEVEGLKYRFRFNRKLGPFRWGQWHDLNEYPFVTILIVNKRAGKRPVPTTYSDHHFFHRNIRSFFQIAFLSKNHSKKIVVFQSDHEEKTLESLQKIIETTGRIRTEYNPPMSMETIQRKRVK
jgi:hypothetical protein